MAQPEYVVRCLGVTKRVAVRAPVVGRAQHWSTEKLLMAWCADASEENFPSEGVIHACLWPIPFFWIFSSQRWLNLKPRNFHTSQTGSSTEKHLSKNAQRPSLNILCRILQLPGWPDSMKPGQVSFNVLDPPPSAWGCANGAPLPQCPKKEPCTKLNQMVESNVDLFLQMVCSLALWLKFELFSFQEKEIVTIQTACSVITNNVAHYMKSICKVDRPLKRLKLVCNQKTGSMFPAVFFSQCNEAELNAKYIALGTELVQEKEKNRALAEEVFVLLFAFIPMVYPLCTDESNGKGTTSGIVPISEWSSSSQWKINTTPKWSMARVGMHILCIASISTQASLRYEENQTLSRHIRTYRELLRLVPPPVPSFCALCGNPVCWLFTKRCDFICIYFRQTGMWMEFFNMSLETCHWTIACVSTYLSSHMQLKLLAEDIVVSQAMHISFYIQLVFWIKKICETTRKALNTEGISEEDQRRLSNFKEMMQGNRFLYHWCDMLCDSHVYAFFVISAGASPCNRFPNMVHFYLLQHWQVVKWTNEKHNHRKLHPLYVTKKACMTGDFLDIERYNPPIPPVSGIRYPISVVPNGQLFLSWPTRWNVVWQVAVFFLLLPKQFNGETTSRCIDKVFCPWDQG